MKYRSRAKAALALISFLCAGLVSAESPNPPSLFAGEAPIGQQEPSLTLGHWVVRDCRELNATICNIPDYVLTSSAVGVVLQLEWRDLEENGDNGWTFENLDRTIAILKNNDKKFGIQLFMTRFGDFQHCLSGDSGDCRPMSPPFMWDDCDTYGGDRTRYPGVHCGSYIGDVNGDIYLHKHNPNVRRQLRELFVQINARYGSDPNFEVFFIPESTQRAGIPDDGWTRTAHVDSLLKIAESARIAMPNKAIYYMTNFLPSESKFNGDPTAFMEYLIANFNIGISWPDTPTCDIGSLISNQLFAKEKYGGTDKVFVQQQGLNYKDSKTSCLGKTPWVQAMNDYILDTVSPGAIGWHTNFGHSTSTTFDDLESQVLSDPNDRLPVE